MSNRYIRGSRLRRLARVPCRTCAAAAFLLLGLFRAGSGQVQEDIDSPYRWIERGLRLGAFGGWLATDRGNLEFGPGDAVVGGVRFRARVSSPLSIELGAGLGSAERFVIDPRLESGPAPVDTASSRWISAELAVQFALTGARTWHGFHPYLLFGGGFLIGVDEEESEVFADSALADFRYDIGTAPLFQVGGGLEVFPSPRLGIGLEARDQLIRLKTPEGFFRQDVLDTIEEAGAEAPKDTQWPSNLHLTLTLWYYP